jgi:hypothetical protein
MKKILLSFVISLIVTASFAQGLPVWGTGAPQNDNTGRILTYGYLSTNASAIGATKDTIKLYPNYFDYLVQPSGTVGDTITYVIPVKPPQAFTGNYMRFYGTAATGSNFLLRFRSGVYAGGVNFKFITAADSTITLTSAKRYYIEFHYDGTSYVEVVKTIGQ